jgi:hypothetical protein
MIEQIDRKIAALEMEVAELRRRKLEHLHAQVAALQASLRGEGTADPRRGQPASKGWIAGLGTGAPAADVPRRGRGRKSGKRVTDAEALALLSKAVSAAGSEGLSALKAAHSSGLAYSRSLALMKKHFKKTGHRKSTRYFSR